MLRLSIILPCYNVEKYIGACLDSLFRQDIPISDYEIICVNDCSTDGTQEVIVSYQTKFPNLKLINHPYNKTAGGARNTGLDAAQGNYVWFVDPDDMLVDNCVGTLLYRAEQNRLEIALFNFWGTIECTNVLIKSDETYIESEICSGINFLEKYVDYNISKTTIVWNQIYNRDFLLRNNIQFPLIRLSEDSIFSWHAFAVAQRVQSEATNRYIYRANSIQNKRLINTAQKVQTRSIHYPIELMNFLQASSLPERFATAIEQTAKHFSSCLFKDYKLLKGKEKRVMYNIIRAQEDIDRLSSLLGKKNKLLLKSRCLSFRMFNLLVKIVVR